MTGILSITFPIYGAITIGFLLVRFGWFSAQDMRVLGNYVLNVALPALLFNAVSRRNIAEVFDGPYMLAFAMAGLATVALAYLWFALTRTEAPRRAVAVMGTSCPNSGFIGYPVMLLIFPDIAGVILALNMLVENIVIIPVCLILMELSRGDQHGSLTRKIAAILWGVIKRPMVLGLLLGLVFSLLRIPMPEPVTRLFDMFAAAAAALSLLVIGGSLVGLPLRGNQWRAAQIAVGKLLLHPAMAAFAVMSIGALGFALSDDMRIALILSAAMPMFGIYAVLAQEQGHEGMASIAMLMATAGSFVTLSVLLALLT
ncbi:AEC family transporter [Lutimaribacter marinistellae]|uniref:AEC family transporter n=1 Tax=Lutimaribacter marinistellae TaxID=1820329 RepID=A0ABV7TAA7_9RHOB